MDNRYCSACTNPLMVKFQHMLPTEVIERWT